MQNTSAVIVCAGSSSRMGGVNKILLPLGSSTVIGHSMLAFQNTPSVKEIIIVARNQDLDSIEYQADLLNISKLKLCVTGGDTRQKSVINGVRLVSKDTDFIAIHDGARPLVNPEFIEKTIKDASVFGGAALGVPVKDTIKVVSDNLIVDTPYRPSLYITQTPQIFRKKIYFEAIDFALEHDLDFTDDCQLVEAIGYKIYMTTGDYKNIKITTPEDIKIAEAILCSE